MKILILGTSNDTGDWIAGAPKRHEIARDRLAAEFGEPVVVEVKNLWPNERVAEFVGKWMADSGPDVVYLNITGFAFTYESLPLRIRRILGPLGQPVSDRGFQLAESKRWAHNRVFRTIRRWGQATIGGDTHCTPDEVIARMSDTIRVITRNEHAVLVVKGPQGRSESGITQRERRRHESKRLYVHRALQAVCEQAHVEYSGLDMPDWQRGIRPRRALAGDGLHSNAAGHAYWADDLFTAIRDAWAKHLGSSSSTARSV